MREPRTGFESWLSRSATLASDSPDFRSLLALARNRCADGYSPTVPSGAPGRAAALRLRRILQNFLSNALRYTRHGHVLLGCRRRGGVLSIQVLDTGPGIPTEHLEQDIFEEFRRFQPRDETGAKGMGLGLAIVQRMARALAHPIRVSSEVGRGSMFAVEVPISGAQAPATPEVAAPRPATRLDEALVLCLDNETTILEGMQQLLEGWSCEVIVAVDTESALAAIGRARSTAAGIRGMVAAFLSWVGEHPQLATLMLAVFLPMWDLTQLAKLDLHVIRLARVWNAFYTVYQKDRQVDIATRGLLTKPQPPAKWMESPATLPVAAPVTPPRAA